MVSVKKSDEFKIRALNVIPHQTGTFSRASDHFVEGIYPSYIESASGAYFTDVDGNKFLDYLCGLGPITLGYNYEPVDSAIINQLRKGILFSLPHTIEVELSELFCHTIPNAEMVKLEKSGSNAVTGAVRAARYLTGKEKIAYCGSGGVWHDWQAAMVSRDGGVPKFNQELIKIFEYNDIDGLEKIFEDNKNQIAAIIIEPTIFEKPQNDFLQKVRKIANQHDSLLIFDEIVTGFRFDLAGCQKLFKIDADLVCFGKGVGNGLPISAITGKTEFMQSFDELWVSSTNNAETLSMAGTIAVINEMKNKDTISHCWSVGKKLFENWNKISESHNLDIKMSGYPVRMNFECFDSNQNKNPFLKALVLQKMIKNGIFFGPDVSYISYSHTNEDIELTLNVLNKICEEIKAKSPDEKYEKLLEGNLPKTIWSMKIPYTKK